MHEFQGTKAGIKVKSIKRLATGSDRGSRGKDRHTRKNWWAHRCGPGDWRVCGQVFQA